MRTRLFYALSPIAAAALAWSLHQMAGPPAGAAATGPAALASAEDGPARGPIPEIAPSDWTWSIQPDGSVEVRCKGSVILKSGNNYWGPGWAWKGVSDIEVRGGPDGSRSLSGRIAGLETDLAATFRSPAPNVVEMEYRLTSARAIPGAIGGGLSWTVKTDAPVLGGRAPGPKVLPGDVGWAWEPVPGREITLRSEPKPAKVAPEYGVRVFFLADGVEPGVRTFRMTLTLPEGASRAPTPDERYEPEDPPRWNSGAFAWDSSPVDLRFLNAADRPAGSRGRVRAEGGRLVLGDGTPARFWGANLAAYALFATPREVVPLQARRMAQLGYNLMRFTHHESEWVKPNVFGTKAPTTTRLDPEQLEKLDWWIKCLKDEGIYVWLDVHVGRTLRAADGLGPGGPEIEAAKGAAFGFAQFNSDVQRLMLDFQRAYLGHVNVHTGLAYQDDPAVAAVLITNENDLTHHFGHMFLPDKKRPWHGALFGRLVGEFASAHGLPRDKVGQTWVPGPSKLFLSDVEHRFNERFLGDLRGRGYGGLAATTSYWGDSSLCTLPALSDGDVIDVHSYGEAEALGLDPRYEPNYAAWIGAVRVAGKPLTITEWNVQYPATDRFTSPLYVAATASLQGWDAPMIYNYSQDALKGPGRPTTWSTYNDPALSGPMPAAALLYRRGHVAPATKAYHLALSPAQLFGRALTPASSATIRTAVEQSRLTIGLPATPELPWLRPTAPPEGAIVLDDPDRDLIPEGQSFVRSDTGELTRDWARGVHVVDAPKTQAASGWIGGDPIETADARFAIRTRKAVVALTSVDDEPLARSRFVLITAVARAAADPSKKAAFVTEPVVGTIELRTEVPDLELLALAADGRVAARSKPRSAGGRLTIDLPAAGGTHWYVLKAAAPAAR